MQQKMKIKKEDQVLVISGNYAGTKGRVLKVFPKTRRVIVEKVNFIKRHTRPNRETPQGGIIEKEAPIHVSNVMLVCPKCNQPTRVGKKVLEDGSRVRICRSCGEVV